MNLVFNMNEKKVTDELTRIDNFNDFLNQADFSLIKTLNADPQSQLMAMITVLGRFTLDIMYL